MEARALGDLGPDERKALFERDMGVADAREDARAILEQVRETGDAALRELSTEYDGVDVGTIEVTDQANRAADELDPDILTAIQAAAANVRAFHERQVPDDWRVASDGRELGRRYRPIDRVGVYAPGGRAAYPSSVLMGAIPATVAGVEHVALATPPGDPVPPATLAAAHVAGVDRIYQVGGAQAIAALAYGTETVDRVQKVVGPGNPWVTAAKAEVRARGACEIDFLAGPSELLVLADDSADPSLVAADMLAQAEHGPDSSVITVTDDGETAEAVIAECERHLESRERAEQIRAALEGSASGVFIARSTSEAVAFAEAFAPEHLAIQARDDEALLDRIDSIGSAFLGPHSPVAAGDYASGPNHVLPTGGTARVRGGLSIEDFLRSTTVQRLSEGGLADLRETITTLARAEGLEGHAASVDARFE